jgi:hypothetical protein
MPRVIHRQITTIQITSVEVTWDEEREQIPDEVIELSPTISESEKAASVSAGKRKLRERKPAKGGKSEASRREVESKREKKIREKPYPRPPGLKSGQPGLESDEHYRSEDALDFKERTS